MACLALATDGFLINRKYKKTSRGKNVEPSEAISTHNVDAATVLTGSSALSSGVGSQHDGKVLGQLFGVSNSGGGSETTSACGGGIHSVSNGTEASRCDLGVTFTPSCVAMGERIAEDTNCAGTESSCDSLPFERGHIEDLEKALRSAETTCIDYQQAIVPPIAIVCDSSTMTSISTSRKKVACPPTDYTRWSRRGWTPTTERLSPRRPEGLLTQLPEQSGRLSGIPTDLVAERQTYRCDNALVRVDDGGSEKRAATRPPAPRQPSILAPRPTWVTLRKRILKVTQQDPSIFSQGFQGKSLVTDRVGSPVRGMNSRYIINRKVLGFRERPRQGYSTQPEWMLFAGGVPPQGIEEHQRWLLRLGYVHAKASE